MISGIKSYGLGLAALLVVGLLLSVLPALAGADALSVVTGSCAAVTVEIDYTRDTATTETQVITASAAGQIASYTWTIPAGSIGQTYNRRLTLGFDAVQVDSTLITVAAGLSNDSYTCSGTETNSLAGTVGEVANAFGGLGIGPLLAMGAIVAGVGLLVARVARALR